MAFNIIQANEVGWLDTANANFAKAYTWDSLAVRTSYVPSVPLSLYPDAPSDTLAVVDGSGNIVPHPSTGYSNLLKRTDTLRCVTGLTQTMTDTAATPHASNISRAGLGQTLTISFKTLVPDGGLGVNFRFSSDYLASVQVDTENPAHAALFMADSTGPSIGGITVGTEVVLSTAGTGAAPAGAILYSTHPKGLYISNNTGQDINVSVLVHYTTSSDITVPPTLERGAQLLEYSPANMTEFTALSNMTINSNSLLQAVTHTTPHLGTTDTKNYVTNIQAITDISSEFNFDNISVSTVADELRSNVEIADGDNLVIVTSGGIVNEVVASGVTVEAGPVYVMDTTSITAGAIPTNVYSVDVTPTFIKAASPVSAVVQSAEYFVQGVGPELFNGYVLPTGYIDSADSCTLVNQAYCYTCNWVDVTDVRQVIITHVYNRSNWHYMDEAGDCFYGGNLGARPLTNEVITLPEGAVKFRMYYANIVNPSTTMSVKAVLPLRGSVKYYNIVGTDFNSLQVEIDMRARGTQMLKLNATLQEF